MKEIKRRTYYFENIGCGLWNYATIDAEIEILDGSDTIYLFASWCNLAPDETLFQATKESAFDIYIKLSNLSEEDEELIAEKDFIESDKIINDDKYSYFYNELKLMINKELVPTFVNNCALG